MQASTQSLFQDDSSENVSHSFAPRRKKRQALDQWLRSLPPESIQRLRVINSSANSAKHIVVCLTIGIYDRNIRKINSMITSLLLTRMKAERSGRTQLVNRINTFMDEMHLAIDAVTGVSMPRKSQQPCNRA